ncbi:MAG TPA: invasion associated locus B family protein [Aestuariivirgaceae bacterium]|nr:invasion associated locus B family protein [Aestuariivirgaceae bacterium]
MIQNRLLPTATALLLALYGIAAISTAEAQNAPQAPAAKNAFGPRVQKAAPAQAANPNRPKIDPPETVATFDDWRIQCETIRIPKVAKKDGEQTGEQVAAAAGGKSDSETVAEPAAAEPAAALEERKFCGMIQTTRFEKRPQIGLTLYISRHKAGDKISTQMKVLAPIGVYLPTGVALEIDGTAVSRVPFSNCLPQVCLARGEASPETLDKLKKGNMANFIIYEGPGAGVPMGISLKGFGKALTALDKL